MMRPSLSIIALSLASTLLFSSCASRRTTATLNDVETYIQARPDSALATLRAIDTTTLTTRSLRAHYALLHAMALDKNWIDTTDVNVVMPAVAYYSKNGTSNPKAKAWYYLGRIQENGKDYATASISFLKAENCLTEKSEPRFRALVYQALSNIYNETHLFEEALNYSERAYTLFIQDGDTLNAYSSLYRKAQDLNNLGRFAESDSLFRFLIASKQVHPNLRASLYCGYARNLVTNQADYEQAVTLFEEVITQYGSLKKANYWGAYAYALMHTGKEKRAEQIFKQMYKTKNSSSSSYVYDSWKSLADAYKGDFADAYYLQKEASDIQSENVQKVLRQSAIKAQKDFLEQVNLESEQQARRRQLVLWVSGIILLVFIVLLVYYFKSRIRRSAQEKESLLEAYKNLTMQQTSLSEQVRNQYIQMCQSHFSHIGRINEILNNHDKEAENNLYKELKKTILRLGEDERSQQKFEKLLNDSFDNVMLHFRESFPGKKPRYYQLVSFLFAGFSSPTICSIISSYNKHNVYVEKSRLKQQILGSDSPYKEQFLQMLL